MGLDILTEFSMAEYLTVLIIFGRVTKATQLPPADSKVEIFFKNLDVSSHYCFLAYMYYHRVT